MKRKQFLSKVLVSAMFLTIVLMISATRSFAQKMSYEESLAAAQNNNSTAFGTGLLSLAPGQAARVAAVNIGDKEVPLNNTFANFQI